MSEKFLGLTITWLLSWSIFAVDQLSTTIHYMNSHGEHVLGERSQETQQASAEKLDNQVNNSSTSEPDTEQSDENICSDEEFWSEVKAEIAPDRRNIILTFPSTPKETGIKSVEIVAKPTTLSYRSSKNAFHMHSIFQERLNISKKEHEIQVNLLNGLDTKYTYLVTDWKLDLIASSKKSDDCYESTFLKINKLNGFIVDTPGIRGFGLVDLEDVEISHLFPEIFKFQSKCKFSDCKHLEEPSCAVREAIQMNKIALSRYNSYLSMLNGDEEEDTFRQDIYKKD